MTIAQIKALFQTGKIPTQADFENLISKIPNDDFSALGSLITTNNFTIKTQWLKFIVNSYHWKDIYVWQYYGG